MTLLLIVLASIFLSLLSLVGGLVLVWQKLNSEKVLAYVVSFAAGTMLAVAFLDLLPEALAEGGLIESVFSAVLLGVVVFFFFERFLLWFHHHDEEHGERPAASLLLTGDALHNFIDGVAIAASFLINPGLGIATTLAIAAHEVPQEIADFSVLLHSGYSKAKALWANFFSALSALAGALIGYFFLEKIEGSLSLFLAFTAGMFIYIACSDLIPDLHKKYRAERRWTQAVPFVLGIILFGILLKLLEG